MKAAPLLLAPLRLEASALRRGAPSAEVVRVGMGPRRAAASCARLAPSLAEGRPVVLAGVAGGLVGELAAGDVVVASAITATEEADDLELADPSVAALLDAAGLTRRLAPIVSSPRILSRRRSSRLAAAAGGAVAVEMEARWLAPLARGRPFAVVRVILDTPSAELASLATPRNVARALRTLRACGAALVAWVPDHPQRQPLTRSSR